MPKTNSVMKMSLKLHEVDVQDDIWNPFPHELGQFFYLTLDSQVSMN